MIITTRALVFSALKYSEADLIVTCFTEDYGLQSYMLPNVLKSKKGKVRASYFLPLTHLEIVGTHKNKGTLERIRDVKLVQPYKTLHTEVVKSSLVMFIAEMLKICIKEEEPNKNLFEYLEHAMLWLDAHEGIANFHILFLLKLTAHLGFYPEASHLELRYFNMLDGTFQDLKTNDYCKEGSKIDAFKQFIGINFDAIAEIKLTKTERSEVLLMLLNYYQIHLQGYKNPRSLVVLNQLFNKL